MTAAVEVPRSTARPALVEAVARLRERARSWAVTAVLGAALCACQARPPPVAPPGPSAGARTARIESTPGGAEVLLSGTARCTTPCTLRLEAGRYQVTLRKTGYLPYQATLLMPLGEDAAISASLVGSH